MLGRIVPLVVAVVVLATPGADARADSTALPIHVVVEAAASCTDDDKFWAAVTSRTSELHRVTMTDEAPVLLVRAWEVAGAVRGELSLSTAHGERFPPRTVIGRTCDEVTSALALALVLALEEGALERPPPREQEPDPEPPSRRPPVPPALPRPPMARANRRHVETSMGAHGILVNASGLATGVGIFSEVRPMQLDGWLSFRLEALAWRRGVGRGVNEAELRWLAIRAQLCVRPVAMLSLSLCGLADSGVFSASATQARNPLSYSAPWAGAGLALNATWNWSRRFGIEAEAGIVAPFVADDLVLRPNVLLFATPAVMTWAGMGPVLHFD